MSKVLRDPKTGRFLGSVGSGVPSAAPLVVKPVSHRAAKREDRKRASVKKMLDKFYGKRRGVNPSLVWTFGTTDTLNELSNNWWYEAFNHRPKYLEVRAEKSPAALRAAVFEAVKISQVDDAGRYGQIWGVLHNPLLSSEDLSILAEMDGGNTNNWLTLVAAHPNTDELTLLRLAEEPQVAQFLLKRESLFPQLEFVLANSKNVEVRKGLLKRSNVSEQARVVANLR